MKKRFGTLVLALILACSLAIPVGAANIEQTPEELYQGYICAIKEVNEQSGMNVTVTPLEEMDTSDMPTVETVREDAIALSETLQRMEVALESATEVQSSSGAGVKTVLAYSAGSWDGAYFIWKISGKFNVNTSTGTPNYYFVGVTSPSVANYSVPSGYYSVAHSALRTYRSADMKTYTIWQTYEVGKGEVSAILNPQAKFTVNSNTGVVTGIAVDA